MKIILLSLAIIFSNNVQAIEGVYTLVIQKQEKKAQTRWTLGEWLVTKKKMALMDQWLAMHSSHEIFEIVAGFDGGNIKLGQAESPQVFEYYNGHSHGALYVYFLGIDYEESKVKNHYWSSELGGNLRFLGTSNQTTHINAQYGVRKLSDQRYGKYKQNFVGVRGAFYLLPFLGISSVFRKYLSESSSDGRYALKGEKWVYSPFLEIGPFRFSIDILKESLYYSGTGASSDDKETRDGVNMGITLIY